LPPLLNDRALFTKAATYGDKDDPFYHSPSNRIAANYSPSSHVAAAYLFEEFPQVGHQCLHLPTQLRWRKPRGSTIMELTHGQPLLQDPNAPRNRSSKGTLAEIKSSRSTHSQSLSPRHSPLTTGTMLALGEVTASASSTKRSAAHAGLSLEEQRPKLPRTGTLLCLQRS
jgi:hypothetical protein